MLSRPSTIWQGSPSAPSGTPQRLPRRLPPCRLGCQGHRIPLCGYLTWIGLTCTLSPQGSPSAPSGTPRRLPRRLPPRRLGCQGHLDCHRHEAELLAVAATCGNCRACSQDPPMSGRAHCLHPAELLRASLAVLVHVAWAARVIACLSVDNLYALAHMHPEPTGLTVCTQRNSSAPPLPSSSTSPAVYGCYRWQILHNAPWTQYLAKLTVCTQRNSSAPPSPSSSTSPGLPGSSHPSLWTPHMDVAHMHPEPTGLTVCTHRNSSAPPSPSSSISPGLPGSSGSPPAPWHMAHSIHRS